MSYTVDRYFVKGHKDSEANESSYQQSYAVASTTFKQLKTFKKNRKNLK